MEGGGGREGGNEVERKGRLVGRKGQGGRDGEGVREWGRQWVCLGRLGLLCAASIVRHNIARPHRKQESDTGG